MTRDGRHQPLGGGSPHRQRGVRRIPAGEGCRSANLAGAGYTALHAAILEGGAGVVKALLTHGADPNAPLKQPTAGRRSSTDLVRPALVGVSPFWLAARFGEPAIMAALAAHGADPLIAKPTSDINWVRAGGEAQNRTPGEPAGTTSLMASITSEHRRRHPLAASAERLGAYHPGRRQAGGGLGRRRQRRQRRGRHGVAQRGSIATTRLCSFSSIKVPTST